MTEQVKILVIVGAVASVAGLGLIALKKSAPQPGSVPMPGYLPVSKSAEAYQAQAQNYQTSVQARLTGAYLIAKYEIAREAQLADLRKKAAGI